MPEDVFLEPCRFTAAAKHYLAGRPAYAKGLISWVVKDLRLGAKDAVMDLGCGPGTLAMLFAPFVRSVLAIDPCPDMLEVARHAAKGVDNVHFKSGSSFDIGSELGTFKLVTIGRAFHWMDRPDTLQRLDAMVEREAPSRCLPIHIQSIATTHGSNRTSGSSTIMVQAILSEGADFQPIGLPTKKFCSLPLFPGSNGLPSSRSAACLRSIL